MADEKNIPVKELEDGSVMAAVGKEDDPFENEESEKPEQPEEQEESDDQPEAEESDEGETDEDRERIREARREERRLKKDLAKQREASASTRSAPWSAAMKSWPGAWRR